MGVHINPFTGKLDVVDSPSGEFTDLTLDAGTASVPSISFDGDTNTGIYSPGADQVAISTNGTGRLFVDASGNVGVGTTSPASTFEVSATSPIIRSTHSLTGDYLQLFHNGSGAYLDYSADDLIIRSASSTERLRVTSDGKVGLGTSTPQAALHVVGGGLFASSTTGGTIIQAHNSDLSSLGYFGVEGSTGGVTLTGTLANSTFISSGASGTALQFGTGGVIRSTLTSTGLGVGTTSPQEELHIVSASQPYIQVQSTGGVTGSAFYGYNSSTGSASIESTGSIRFAIPGSEAARIDSSGRLGLGTSDPGSLGGILAVQKNQTADTAIVVDNSGAAGASTSSSFIVSDGGSARGWFRRYRDGTGNTALGFTDAFLFEGNIGGTKATRMVIDSSGRVGVGTSTPASKLSVSNGGAEGIEFGPTNGDIFTYNRSTSAYTNMLISCNEFVVRTNGSTERLRIDSSGRLLVGTSSTSNIHKLVVRARTDDSNGNGGLILMRGSTPSASDQAIGFIGFTDQNDNNGAWIYAESEGSWTSGSNHRSRLVFSTTADGASSPTERMRIDSTGQVRLAGAGITFNGDTATANELDDYEEGTWTPAITGSTTAGTIGYDNQVGKYTKIGRQVTVSCNCDTAVVTTAPTGDIRVSGLPFTPSAGSEFIGAAELKGIPFPASTTYVVVEGINGQTYVEFFGCGSDVSASHVQANSLATDDYIRFTLTYFV